MTKGKIERHYVSPIDLFIKQYDKDHTGLSASQQKEVDKYQRIYHLRDVKDRPDEKKMPEGL